MLRNHGPAWPGTGDRHGPESAAEQIAIPVTLDDNACESEIAIHYKSLEEIQAEFEAGQLNESDFAQQQAPLPETVLVDAPELPPEIEPAWAESELLLNQEQAEELLDSLTGGEWRRWGRPPILRTSGRGWVMSGWSEFDLREWVRRRIAGK